MAPPARSRIPSFDAVAGTFARVWRSAISVEDVAGGGLYVLVLGGGAEYVDVGPASELSGTVERSVEDEL